MDNLINNTLSSGQTLNNDFVKYSANTTLLTIASAIVIGIASKDLIEKFMNDILLPIIKVLGKGYIPLMIYKLLLKNSTSAPTILFILKTFGNIFWIFLIWSIMIFISFVLFKKLLDKNLVSLQLGLLHRSGKTVQEFFKKNF
jgi:large-conductance mechanosensitive channel